MSSLRYKMVSGIFVAIKERADLGRFEVDGTHGFLETRWYGCEVVLEERLEETIRLCWGDVGIVVRMHENNWRFDGL